MKKYAVYFEIYGKKMKVNVEAISKVQAENIVKSKLHIHKVVEQRDADNTDEVVDFLKKALGMD